MLLASLLDRLTDSFLRWLGSLLRSRYLPPRAPGAFTFTVTQVITPMGTLAFNVKTHLPAMAVPEDVATRELTLTVNGVAHPSVSVDPPTADFDFGNFNVADALSASLVDIDPSGNRSDPKVETVTVTDTQAPPAPGEFGFSVTQVVTPDPAPPAA